eukprot:CAMPEP_0114578208 /NCGR_PEP_ID=MMETSP0125-20121206/2776_1 /TAXON_ID=485358 ORGANISM="Aristerostoma sp., Strain ATCC 50986" /NCGR_SAMPLE_ID=MMETSP0125 /ASSEMBLY_ACC=CAM_ASM_000245 /LENGTH=192 /DNA_ID=CAMNT_0001768105 /DNA_START=1110 /DNA_END=1689 /DNA_ORIENTATION=+
MDANLNNVTIQDVNQFEDENFNQSSSAITIDYNGQYSMVIENSKFIDIYSDMGAALKIMDTHPDDGDVIRITDSNFTNTKSELEGGAIYSTYHTLDIHGNTFTGCESLNRTGAAIYSIKQIDFEELQNNNTFTNCEDTLGTIPNKMVVEINVANETGIAEDKDNKGRVILENVPTWALADMNISVTLDDVMG